MEHNLKPGDHVRITTKLSYGVTVTAEGRVRDADEYVVMLDNVQPWATSWGFPLYAEGPVVDVAIEVIRRALPTEIGAFIVAYDPATVRSVVLQLAENGWASRSPDDIGTIWPDSWLGRLRDVVSFPANYTQEA